MDVFEPSAWTRKSVVLARILPAEKALDWADMLLPTAWTEDDRVGLRMWDSARRRRSSRSCLRREGASSGRSLLVAAALEVEELDWASVGDDLDGVVWSGILEDCYSVASS